MIPFFANPLFLWLLPLAAVPVLFHLFFRVRKRPRPFSTLMFFHRLDPRLSARKQIREWLILALRVLLLLLVLLALARPRWLAGWGGGSVAVVLVVDNSGSMSGAKLKTAVEAANAVIGALEPNDTAGLALLVEDPTVTLPAGLTADKPALRSALNRIAETEATGAVADTLRRALAMLEHSSATRFEVHIFTDLHTAEWARATEMPAARAGVTLTVHRIASPMPKEGNIALTSVDLPGRRLLAGRALPARVTLQNTTAITARARLNAIDDAGNPSAQEIVLIPREEKTLTLVFNPANAGFHWFNVWVEGDAFAADNRAAVGYHCAERGAVLFAGQADDFGVLPVAIAPNQQSGLNPMFITPAALSAEIESKKPLLVVLPAGVSVPEAYVAQGGNALVLPAAEGAEAKKDGAPVLVFQKSAPLFADLRDEKGDVALRNVRAFQFAPVPANGDVLLGLEDGRALLVERQFGKGRIFTSGLAFTPTWSTLPLKGAFLALAQSMALIGEDPGNAVQRLTAGERPLTLTLSPPRGEGTFRSEAPLLSPVRGGEDTGEGARRFTGPVHIRSVAGSPLDWKGQANNAPVLPRAGVYVVEAGNGASYVSVQSSALEGRWEFVSGDKVPALASLTHTVRNYSTPAALANEFKVVSRGLDFYLPLLLAGLAALVGEGWLANQPPRKTNPKSESRNPKE